jgi:hypothetical protein
MPGYLLCFCCSIFLVHNRIAEHLEAGIETKPFLSLPRVFHLFWWYKKCKQNKANLLLWSHRCMFLSTTLFQYHHLGSCYGDFKKAIYMIPTFLHVNVCFSLCGRICTEFPKHTAWGTARWNWSADAEECGEQMCLLIIFQELSFKFKSVNFRANWQNFRSN